MAFVFESQRKVNEVSKLTNPVGPGQYFQEQLYKKNEVCAPFNSTGIRKTIFDEKPIIKTGPGQYDIAKNIIEPNIKTVSNSHSIIVKINSTGTSQFKSNRQRFGHDETEVPGPGSYNHDQMKKSRKVSLSSPIRSPAAKLKAFTQSLKKYPAIPQKVRGLTDMKNQELIPEQEKLGPGHYNPSINRRLNLTSTVWGKDKTKRFSMDNIDDLGPGKYKVDLSGVRQKNSQPSSHFRSATVRTYFDSLYYRTNLNKTARERDFSNFKTKDPAPGQYEVNKSSFMIKEKPFSFQFFGSTVQRFTDQIHESLDKNKSPTFYNVSSTFGKTRSFNKATHSFNSQTERDPSFLKQAKQKQFIPGPGHYKQKIVVERKLRGQKVQKFGSTTSRPFLKKEQPDQLGPGKYLNRQTNKEEQIMKNKFGQIKEISSNFKSTTSRDCFGKINSDVPLGQYDVSYTDISKKIEKQKNYLQNLKKIQVQKAPFESTHSRFPHYEQKSPKKQKKTSLDEINRQHQLKLKDQKQKVRSAIIEFNRSQLKEKQVKGHFGKSERFSQHRRGAPPVGQYKIASSFQKKTFNIKYANQQK